MEYKKTDVEEKLKNAKLEREENQHKLDEMVADLMRNGVMMSKILNDPVILEQSRVVDNNLMNEATLQKILDSITD